MTNRFLKIANFFEEHWLSLVVILGVSMLMAVMLIINSWLVGYWCNALYNTKFDLGACGAIMNAIIAGLGALVTTAGAGWAKFHTNSKYNTEQGSLKEKTYE